MSCAGKAEKSPTLPASLPGTGIPVHCQHPCPVPASLATTRVTPLLQGPFLHHNYAKVALPQPARSALGGDMSPRPDPCPQHGSWGTFAPSVAMVAPSSSQGEGAEQGEGGVIMGVSSSLESQPWVPLSVLTRSPGDPGDQSTRGRGWQGGGHRWPIPSPTAGTEPEPAWGAETK